MEELRIEELLVSQDGVHTASQIPSMVEHAQNGGVFNRSFLDDWAWVHNIKPAPLIKITFFPDGVKLIQDGHHRTLSIYMGGLEIIHPEEYFVEHWNYDDYLKINPKRKWVTPYDPRTQVRQADFKEYKELALEVYDARYELDRFNGWVEERADAFAMRDLVQYAEENSDLYRKSRNVYSIPDLVEIYEREHGDQNSQKAISRVQDAR
jgi:hypothetical protein